MFSFNDGMQSFPKALANKFSDRIILNASITGLIKKDNKYIITYNHNDAELTIEADIVISTLPAYTAAGLFKEMDPALSEHLLSIYYPPVMVLFLGYEKSSIGQPLDGFGFLIPQKEKKSFLGAIWSSVIFPERADENHAAFTLFVGGARSPELFNLNKDELKEMVLKEFQAIMKITDPPVFIAEKMWEKAIPQYNIGYIEHERYFEKFEQENKGIILSGNYRGGISVGDCVKNSEINAKKVRELIQN
jgi:oxygen-dependent protoporphyrinogen oxidase